MRRATLPDTFGHASTQIVRASATQGALSFDTGVKLPILFWVFLIIVLVSWAPKPYSNYQGPYITRTRSCRVLQEDGQCLAARGVVALGV